MFSRTSRLIATSRNVIRVARLEPFDTSTEEGRSLERYRRIVLSTGASVAGSVMATLVTIVSVPLVLNSFGKDFFGLWSTVLSMTPWVALLDMGIVAGLVVALSEANGRDDRRAAKASFSAALIVLGLAALVASLLVAAVLLVAPWEAFLRVPASLPGSSVGWGTALAGILACLSLPLGLSIQAFAGYQKAYVGTLFAAGGSLLSLVLLVAVVSLQAPPALALPVAVLGGLVAAGLCMAWLFRAMPWLRPASSAVTGTVLRKLFGRATPLYLFQIGALLVNQTQRPLLASQVGLETVAEYDLLLRIYVLSITFITVSNASVGPSLRESVERGELTWMRRTFWHVVRLRMLAAAGACVILIGGGNLLLRLWLRRVDFQFDLWTWLTLSMVILGAVWGSTFHDLLTILDRTWPQVGLVLIQGPLTVALTWYLGGLWGIKGALLALGAPTVLIGGWWLPLFAGKFLVGGVTHIGDPTSSQEVSRR